ncbi:MAG: FAD-dependent monooxygenase [Arenibacterium sp.]
MTETDALVVGGGPAGLMAAEVLSAAGHRVVVAEAKPSFGRKFLMAGKSGLNLTKAEDVDDFINAYEGDAAWLRPTIEAFGPADVQTWASSLGISLFTGSTGRVFPKEMKASPLLRAWLARLAKQGVAMRNRHHWTGWRGPGCAAFQTSEGETTIRYKTMILALGGASWRRLGSDGEWQGTLAEQGVPTTPFAPSNAALRVAWSTHMQRHFGAPLKNVSFQSGGKISRGEAILSQNGIEGGGIYALSRPIRDGHDLTIDLLPDMAVDDLSARLAGANRKESLTNQLRKRTNLTAARIALLHEFSRPLPSAPGALAHAIKTVPIRHNGLAPIDEAISTAGGISRSAVDSEFMLTNLPGVFCAGEMLDWDAPTGGYLLTVCFATGRAAGGNAAKWLAREIPSDAVT